MTALVCNEVTKVTLVKDNHHTCWVQLADGNVIKRHKVKHQVQ